MPLNAPTRPCTTAGHSGTAPLGPHLRISPVVLDGTLLLDLHACVYQASLAFGLLVLPEATCPLLLHDICARCSSRGLSAQNDNVSASSSAKCDCLQAPQPKPKASNGSSSETHTIVLEERFYARAQVSPLQC